MALLSLNSVFAPRRCTRVFSLRASSDLDQMRAQIDELHQEAEQTRTKANVARMRLLRLSEAAEKLQRQATIHVRGGKENDARELLVQKKKVMGALDKSKRRIELLNGLSAKLNEAILMKERQLIGSVTVNMDENQDAISSPIRIITPKEVDFPFSNEPELSNPHSEKCEENQIQEICGNIQQSPTVEHQKKAEDTENEDAIVGSLNDITSFDELMKRLNQHLCEIEDELNTVIRISTLMMETEQERRNTRVRRILEILEDVKGIRSRIEAGISQTQTL